jgi:CRISPR-associated endonuclease/helicase Cas3
MTEIISHPGKPLILHLRQVARNCHVTLSRTHVNHEFGKATLEDLGYIQGALHDIGKATKNFQIYIKSGGREVPQPKHHALISAYLAKFVADKYLKRYQLEQLTHQLLIYFVFTSVKRHHGHVHDFTAELESLQEKEDDLAILIENFHEQETENIINDLLARLNISISWQDFKDYMSDLDRVFIEFADFACLEFEDKFEELSDFERSNYFYLHHLLFSSLLYADKTDVKLGKDGTPNTAHLDFKAVQNFRTKKGWNKGGGSPINQLKNQAYFESLKYIEDSFDPEHHFYSISLPTGLGKTITSLAVAMAIKHKLKDLAPRIIITIPFTSIIDQNYTVFEEIFESPSSTLLLKHHHLADPKYQVNEDTVMSVEQSQFLIETWQSEIIVTTFVQLLESIFTNRNNKIQKLPSLMNAVIILDEIQQIKYELWPLIRTAFQSLGNRYNCYFLLMSATQPLIFTPEKEIREIVPQYEQYFQFFNRTKLINKTKLSISLQEYADDILAYHNQHPEKSILAILNTKDSTRKCFERIKDQIPEGAANLYFLTTSITPYERKVIINRIKTPPNSLPNIIISTQLIEAGVDISVDAVFRALAPLDSIIQAAGRANRYFEKETACPVFIYRIEDIDKISRRLYGNELLVKTENVLRPFTEVEEKDYLQLIQAYFKEVQVQSQALNSELVDELLQLNFEAVGKFNFIEYRKTESLFVQLNPRAKALWEQFIQIYQNKQLSIFEKREQFALIKAEFYDYVINIPVPWDEESIKFDGEKIFHFYLSPLNQPSIFYHYQEGSFRENLGYFNNELLFL